MCNFNRDGYPQDPLVTVSNLVDDTIYYGNANTWADYQEILQKVNDGVSVWIREAPSVEIISCLSPIPAK